MCKLCDKIYHCTEALPELQDCIELDPEGALLLMIVHYDHINDSFYHSSFSINFCPECGKYLLK